jgi:hypothetical protein
MRHQIWINADILQTRDSTQRIRRMKRRDDQMPGQRDIRSDLRCFPIADLTDHDDIRILANQRP